MDENRNEDRSNFVRLANKRVNNVLNHLRLVGNLSNTSNYYYTEEDVKKIFDVMERELEECKQKFESRKKTKASFLLEE
ncbi:MAG TPA: hypothetical protein PKI93_07090 [Alphaproteobacteria bacterium]|nr:hypothetical protein [Alphaproteobacteria bacterium]